MDGTDRTVVEARLGTAAGPAYAVFRTAHGEWRIEWRIRHGREWTGKGPRPMWRDTMARKDLFVVDASDQEAATIRGGLEAR